MVDVKTVYTSRSGIPWLGFLYLSIRTYRQSSKCPRVSLQLGLISISDYISKLKCEQFILWTMMVQLVYQKIAGNYGENNCFKFDQVDTGKDNAISVVYIF